MKPINQSRSYFYHTLLFLLLAMGLLGCGRSIKPPPIPTIPPTDTPIIEIIEPPSILQALPTPPDAPLEQDPLSNDFSDYRTISGSAEIIEPPALTTPEEAALAVVRIRGCDASSNCTNTNQGSGAIIHPNGIILTAWHVTVLDSRNQALPDFYDHFLIEITDDVSRPPQPRYYARWIAYNTQDDLALLRIVGEFGQSQENWEQTIVDLPWLPISNDDQLASPDLWVIGYPPEFRTIDMLPTQYSGLEAAQIRVRGNIPKGYSGGPTLVQRDGRYEVVGVVSYRVQDVGFIRRIQQLDNLLWRDEEQMWAEGAQIVQRIVAGTIQSQLEVTVHTLGYRATEFDLLSALLLISDDQEHKAQQKLLSANFVNIQQLSIPLDQSSKLFDQPLFVSIFRLDEGESWRVEDWIRPPVALSEATFSPTAVDTPISTTTHPPTIPTPTLVAATATLTVVASTATPVPPTTTDTSIPPTPITEITATIPPETATATATVIPFTPTPNINTTRVSPNDGATYMYVPKGKFLMGSTDYQVDFALDICDILICPRSTFTKEQPQKEIYLDSFWIMQTEVTIEQYSKFIEAGGYTNQAYWSEEGWSWKSGFLGMIGKTEPGKYWNNPEWNGPQQPVISVSWFEAEAYANWLSAETNLIYKLPTEAQWEKAARGTEAFIFPWGDIRDPEKANSESSMDDYEQTAPVGSFPAGASPYGVLDMAGNVLEWTLDRYDQDYYKRIDSRNPVNMQGNALRTIRGGAWDGGQITMRTTYRYGFAQDTRFTNVGFRLVMLSPDFGE